MTELRGLHVHQHAYRYTAALGMLSLLERKFPKATAHWTVPGLVVTIPLDDILDCLAERAAANDWSTPIVSTSSLPFMASARRDPSVHVATARHFLTVYPEENRLELKGLLTEEPALIRKPKKLRGTNKPTGRYYAYCLGSLMPNAIEFNNNLPEPVSAWLSVLCHEATNWMTPGETLGKSYGWRGGKDGESGQIGLWILPAWTNPMELRRIKALFRPRGKHTPLTWSRWLRWRGREAEKNPEKIWRARELCNRIPTHPRYSLPGETENTLDWAVFKIGTFLGAHSNEIFGVPYHKGITLVDADRRQARPTPERRFILDSAAAPKKRGRPKKVKS